MSAVVDGKKTDSGLVPGADKGAAPSLDKVTFSVVTTRAGSTEAVSLEEVTFSRDDVDRARKYLVDLVHPAKADATEASHTAFRSPGSRTRFIPTERAETAGPVRVRASDPGVKELIRDLPRWQEVYHPEKKVSVRELIELGKQGADTQLSQQQRIEQQLTHIRKQLELGRSVRVDVSMVSDAQATKGNLAQLIKEFKATNLLRVHVHGTAEEKEQIAQALGEKLHTKEWLSRSRLTVEPRLTVEQFAAEVRAEQEHNAPLNRLRRWGERQLERISSIWSGKKESEAADSKPAASPRREAPVRSDRSQSATAPERKTVSAEQANKYIEQLQKIGRSIDTKWAQFSEAVGVAVLLDGDQATVKPPTQKVITIPSLEVLKVTFGELASMRKEHGGRLRIAVSPEVAKYIEGLSDDRRRAIKNALGLDGVDQRKKADA